MASTSKAIDLEDGSEKFVRTLSRESTCSAAEASVKKSEPSNGADAKSSTSTYILVPISFCMDGSKVKLDLKNVSGKAKLVSTTSLATSASQSPLSTASVAKGVEASVPTSSRTHRVVEKSTSWSRAATTTTGDHSYSASLSRNLSQQQGAAVNSPSTRYGSATVANTRSSLQFTSATPNRSHISPARTSLNSPATPTTGVVDVSGIRSFPNTPASYVNLPSQVAVRSDTTPSMGQQYPFTTRDSVVSTKETVSQQSVQNGFGSDSSSVGLSPQAASPWSNRDMTAGNPTNGKRSLSDDHSSPYTNSSVGSPLTQLLPPLMPPGVSAPPAMSSSVGGSPHFSGPSSTQFDSPAGRSAPATVSRTPGSGKKERSSPVLCAYPLKACKQHRVNGYAYCIRHILQDPTAPYKLCEYVRSLPKRHVRCTNPVPDAQGERYCTTHLITMGMKERKLGKKAARQAKLLEVAVPTTSSLTPVESSVAVAESGLKSPLSSLVDAVASGSSLGPPQVLPSTSQRNMTSQFGKISVDFPMPSNFMEESASDEAFMNEQVSNADVTPVCTSVQSFTPVAHASISGSYSVQDPTPFSQQRGDFQESLPPPIGDSRQPETPWTPRFAPLPPTSVNGSVSSVPKHYRSWASPSSSDRGSGIMPIQPNSSYSSASEHSSSAACTPDSHFLSPRQPYAHSSTGGDAGQELAHTPGEVFHAPSPSIARRSADHVAEYLVPSISPDTLSSPGLASSQLSSPRLSSGFRPTKATVFGGTQQSAFRVEYGSASVQQAADGFAFPAAPNEGLACRVGTPQGGNSAPSPQSAPVHYSGTPRFQLLAQEAQNPQNYGGLAFGPSQGAPKAPLMRPPLTLAQPPAREPSFQGTPAPVSNQSLFELSVVAHSAQPDGGPDPAQIRNLFVQPSPTVPSRQGPSHPSDVAPGSEASVSCQQAAESLARAAQGQARSQVIRLSPKGFFRMKAPCRFRKHQESNSWTKLVDRLDEREFGRRDLFPLGFELSESEDDTSSDDDVPLPSLLLGSKSRQVPLDRLTSYSSLVADTRQGLKTTSGLASALSQVWQDVPGTSKDDELRLLARLLVDRDKQSRKQVVRENLKWPEGARSDRRCYSQTGGQHCASLCLPWANFCQEHLPQSLDQCLFAYCTQPGCHNPTFDPLPAGPKCRLHQDYKNCLDESIEVTTSGTRRRKPRRYMGISQKRRRRKPSLLSTPTPPPPTSSRLLSPVALSRSPLPTALLRGTPPVNSMGASPPTLLHNGPGGSQGLGTTGVQLPSSAMPPPADCLPGPSRQDGAMGGDSLTAGHPLDFDSLASTSRETHEAQISLDSVAHDLGFKAEELFSLPDDDLANLITDRNDKNKSEENLLDLEPPPRQHSWADVEQFLLSEGYRPQ